MTDQNGNHHRPQQQQQQQQQQEVQELLTFFDTTSPQPILSVDTLLQNLSATSSPKSIFDSIVPHIFHKDPKHQEAAETLFVGIISHKPLWLLDAATAMRSYVKSLVENGLDSKQACISIYPSTLKLMIDQLSHSNVSIADVFTTVMEILCLFQPDVTGTVLDLLCPIPVNDATLMIRYYTLCFKIIPTAAAAATTYPLLMKPFLSALQNDQDPLLQISLLEILQQIGDWRDDGFLENWYEPELDCALLKMVGQNVQVIQQQGEKARGQIQYGSGGVGGGDLDPFCSGAALRLLAMRHQHLDRKDYVQVLIYFGRKMNGEVEKIGFVDGITTFCCCCHVVVRNGHKKDALLSSSSSSAAVAAKPTTTTTTTCINEGGDVTTEPSNLDLVLQNQELLNDWLTLRMGQSKLKAVVMNSVARVLQVKELLHSSRLELYQMIGKVNDVGGGEDTTQIVMQHAKGQVVELRLAAYEILTAVAKVHMGAHVLMKFGGFFEFLCNRNLEIVKEGKELKYGLVKAIWNSEVKGLLADDIARALEQVVLDGPFYVKQVRDVAVE
jgi:Proteasome non-ATPase 26S subunit.